MGCLIVPMLVCVSTPALADGPGDQIDDMDEQAEAVARAVSGKEAPGKSGKDILAVPLPITNPTLGTGLVVAGVAFYNPNNAPSPWITGGAAMKTSNGNWLVGGFHSMSLDGDRYRLNAAVGAGDLVMDYYGIGPEAGDRNISTNLHQKIAVVRLQGQMRVAPGLYAGVRMFYASVDATQKDLDPTYPDLAIPPGQENTDLAQIGPVVTYDTRDNSLNPRHGVYAHAEWLLSLKVLGGDFTSRKLTAGVSWYVPSGSKTVWALHGGLCGASSGAPFYDLCLYGQKNDLRGYKTGRYRDRASWAMQVEWRRQLFGRFGAVAFGGIGGTAPRLDRLDDTKFLPAGGVGLRYQPSRKTNINLRLDLAVGRDSRAVYLGIAEAF
ncbi:BamA/TamA family outer membrane protein [Novosphingobium sp. PhB165]|uniref:BamA/TamA family outer membrane protein n=1 Tax=Novosphingobium sp. PhB165 TaxID=2485105 RepID=UPI00140452EE|nr:BamA/TamA family outer membrane protein [Novosphingobium sp. PhB165]